MRRVLLLFIDGIGLGAEDPLINPFAVADLPTLHALSGGQRWLASAAPFHGANSAFIPTDAQLGVAGRPQSGSNQAVILTGRNVPQHIGEHYGPKPNEAIRALLSEDNLFIRLKALGKRAALLEGYPNGMLADIARGKTIPSSIQYAAIASGQALFTQDDVIAGRALTAEWTGEEWHTHLKLSDAPRYTSQEAGRLLAQLALGYDFALHGHWLTDYIGHRGTLADGVRMLERMDGVLAGLLETWPLQESLILLTSDHGNLEHIGNRNHTENRVPTLLIGTQAAQLAPRIHALTDIAPLVIDYLRDA